MTTYILNQHFFGHKEYHRDIPCAPCFFSSHHLPYLLIYNLDSLLAGSGMHQADIDLVILHGAYGDESENEKYPCLLSGLISVCRLCQQTEATLRAARFFIFRDIFRKPQALRIRQISSSPFQDPLMTDMSERYVYCCRRDRSRKDMSPLRS